MADHIRDRINRKLASLNDDRLYQVLDFVEFLELRYGQPAANPTPANPFQRFADGVEDRLRAGGIAASTVSEAMGFLNKAVGALNNVATAGRTVATGPRHRRAAHGRSTGRARHRAVRQAGWRVRRPVRHLRRGEARPARLRRRLRPPGDHRTGPQPIRRTCQATRRRPDPTVWSCSL